MTERMFTEAELIEAIERLERDIRDTRRRIEHAHTPADRRALNRQMDDSIQQIENLRARLNR
jgi:hypothetical protein